jgi:hypothetical protein
MTGNGFHELTLVFADGETQILTHEKKDSP